MRRPTPLALLVVCAALAGCGRAESPSARESSAPEPEPEPEPEPDPAAPPCSRYASTAAPIAHVLGGELDEISGLAVSRLDPSVLWAIEDSGNDASVFALDRTGRLLGTVELAATFNLDFEDLAVGPCPAGSCLYVADIGDNAELRPAVSILRFPEPAPRDGTADVEEFRFTYPDGAQDAEAMVVTPDGTPVVLTKRKDGTSRLYRMRLDRALAEAEPLGTLDVLDQREGLFSAVTAADLSDDGSALFVRTYGSGMVFRLGVNGISFAPSARREILALAAEVQGEALAFDPKDGGVLHVSEGDAQPIFALRCATR